MESGGRKREERRRKEWRRKTRKGKLLDYFAFCRFDYIDPPEERMIMEALKQLYILGALNRLVVVLEIQRHTMKD